MHEVIPSPGRRARHAAKQRAYYELLFGSIKGESVDPLRYGRHAGVTEAKANEIGLLRLRYKQPGADQSQLIEKPMNRSQIHAQPSERMRFAASVAPRSPTKSPQP